MAFKANSNTIVQSFICLVYSCDFTSHICRKLSLKLLHQGINLNRNIKSLLEVNNMVRVQYLWRFTNTCQLHSVKTYVTRWTWANAHLWYPRSSANNFLHMWDVKSQLLGMFNIIHLWTVCCNIYLKNDRTFISIALNYSVMKGVAFSVILSTT
jgi:hypothetical protein